MNTDDKQLQQQEAFEEYLILKGYTAHTRVSMRNTVKRFIQWAQRETIEPEAITYNDMMAYVSYCKQIGNKQISIQGQISSIKQYYNFLLSREETTTNPCVSIDIRGIRRKMLRESFTTEELDTIYKNYRCDNTIVFKRNKIILGLLIYQGLRTEEVGRLTVRDIKVREGKITVAGSRRTEGRELPLEAHQLYDLMDYINETRKIFLAVRGNKETETLFLSFGNSERFSNLMIKLVKRLHKQDSRIKDIKQIRASVIVNWLKVYNIRKVQHLAGHRYVSSTESYQNGNMYGLVEEVNKYHPDF